MKILHTADWHLGQRLYNGEQYREEEHNLFLRWLLDLLRTEPVDALLIAGDIFDIGYPPNFAVRQYYNFLNEARHLCRNIIITGGNHDAVATLNAPRDLLQTLQIHVIGGAAENIADEIVLINDANAQPIGVVAAVPFLRQTDIRSAVAGETYTEKLQQIKEGIRQHYRQVCDLMLPYRQQGLPLVAMGHLFAAGSETSDSEREIHIGNQAQVYVESFPAEFDYVALGHIHKPQIIAQKQHIRYCGSPIALSFSERQDPKQVVMVSFETPNNTPQIELRHIPAFRPLVRMIGSPHEIEQQINAFEVPDALLMPWVEIHLQLEQEQADWNERIKTMAIGKNMDILNIKILNLPQNRLANARPVDLNLSLREWNHQDIFAERCREAGYETPPRNLLQAFSEIVESCS
jgi:exonuclease SbcD